MIVMDANAALAIAMGLDVGDALDLLQQENEEIIAPSLINSEVAHALSKYIQGDYLSLEDATACGRDALLLIDRFIDDGTLWVEALGESIRLNHSSYDMFYFLLARREGATLFTLDQKLQKLCAKNGVNCIMIETI